MSESERPPVDPLREALQARWDSLAPDNDPVMKDSDVASFYLPIGVVRAALASAAAPRPEGNELLREALDRLLSGGEPDAYLDMNDPTYHAVVSLYVRLASPAAPVATMHTCWDNHEGPDGTHADGSPCRDKATPLYASPAVPRPEGLDVERLGRAMDTALPTVTRTWEESAALVIAEYQRLSDTGDTPTGGTPRE